MKEYVYYCWICDLIFTNENSKQWHKPNFIKIGEL